MNYAAIWTRLRFRLPGFLETTVTTLLVALVALLVVTLGGCSTYNHHARPWSISDADPPGAARYVDDGIAAWDRGDYRAAAIAFRLAADSDDTSNPRFVRHARAAECQSLLMLRDLGALSACSDQLDSAGSYPAPRTEVSLTRSLAAHAAGKSVASWELPTQTLRTALALERVDQTVPALWNRIREAKTELEDLAVTAEPTLEEFDVRIERARDAVVHSQSRTQAGDAWTTALELEVEKVERQMRFVKRGRNIAERIAVDARRLEKRLTTDTRTPESRAAVQELEGNQFQGLADATTKLYARLDLESAEVERMGNLLRTAWTSRAEDLPQIEVTAGGVKAWADSLAAEFRAKQGELQARKQLVRSLLDRAILGELDQFRTAILDHPGTDSLLGRDDASEDSIATLASLYDYATGQTPVGGEGTSAFESTGLDSLDYFASGNHVSRRTAAATRRHRESRRDRGSEVRAGVGNDREGEIRSGRSVSDATADPISERPGERSDAVPGRRRCRPARRRRRDRRGQRAGPARGRARPIVRHLRPR